VCGGGGWDFWFWVSLNLRLDVKNSKVVSYRIQFQVVFQIIKQGFCSTVKFPNLNQ
jgi:hypothetical protein